MADTENAVSGEPTPPDEQSAEAMTQPVSSPGDTSADIEAKTPEFAEVTERVVNRLDKNPERLHGVTVPVWAELGRVEMLIGDLLQLGEGSVVRLNRSVGDPVDLISQGVILARGEVVVVEDCFAIRIREILSGK